MIASVERKAAYRDTLQALTLRLTGRSWAHVTPGYVVDRLRVALYQRRHPDHPWLTAQAVAILDTWLKPADEGLEWGSGRSTVWFARRVGRLTSVEHHPEWHERVGRLLAFEGVADKVDYRLLPDGASEQPTSAYVRTAQDIPDGSLDFALVDGVARASCAEAVLPKIRPGGLLVIDNANWFLPPAGPSRSPRSRHNAAVGPLWQEVGRQLAAWRCIWTSDGVTDTALWMKPR